MSVNGMRAMPVRTRVDRMLAMSLRTHVDTVRVMSVHMHVGRMCAMPVRLLEEKLRGKTYYRLRNQMLSTREISRSAQ